MSQFEISIPNLKDLQRAIKDYPKIANPKMSNAINKTLAILTKSATPEILAFKTPSEKRTHYLEATWGAAGKGLELARPDKLTGKIWTLAKYGIYVHEGTKYIHPNKFIPRIIIKGQEEINTAFKTALEGILEEIAKKASQR